MPKPKVIEDYYGTALTVQPLVASPGPMVDLEADGVQDQDGSLVDHSEFYRLTPEQARNLATQLNEAADEIDPAGVSTDAA